MTFRRLLPALALAFVAIAARADDRDELRRLDREITVATWTADTMWFQENLSDDYLLITPGGMRRTKRDVINELSTPGLRMEPYEPSEVDVRIYGDAAVVTGRMLQRYTIGRIRQARDLRYTDVYVRRKGRWILVGGHASSVVVRR